MSDDEDLAGGRESLLMRNGGVTVGGDVPVYDGLPGFPPGGHGRSWQGSRAGHPPLDCPSPRLMATLRGYYRCPACGLKVRLAGSRTWREDGYERADRVLAAVGEAVRQCADLARELPRWAEVAVGLVLLAGPALAWLSAQGWLEWR